MLFLRTAGIVGSAGTSIVAKTATMAGVPVVVLVEFISFACNIPTILKNSSKLLALIKSSHLIKVRFI